MSSRKFHAPPDPETSKYLNSASENTEQLWYQIKPGYCIRNFGGESLVIPIGGASIAEQQMAILSPVGRFLWDRLQTGQTFENLLRAVLDEYEVTRKEAKADIEEFLLELRIHKYLNEERKYVK